MISLAPISLNQAIHAALEFWTATDRAIPEMLSDLLIVRQQGERDRFNGTINWTRAVNEVLLAGIEELEKESEQGGGILRRRFLDGEGAKRVAHQMNLSRDQVNRRQRRAIDRLAQIIWGLEEAVREQRITELEGSMPPASYEGELVGVDELLSVLMEKVLAAEAPWTIVLTGIGGIGKTSLADGVVRRVLRHFIYERVVWVRLEVERPFANIIETIFAELAHQLDLSPHLPLQQQIKQVRHILKQSPYLLVVDNIEAEADTMNLLLHLNDLTDPSKIILTTRTRPPSQASVWVQPLDELSLSATNELVQRHAALIGFQDMVAITAEQIAALYQLTGGNPLAIKLVVGLAQIMPLAMVLQDLHKARTSEIEKMYRYIYWRAWHSLTKSAQTLLKMMPLAADIGFTPPQMMATSSLSEELFWSAVYELVSRSLLEARGTTWDRRYGIHRLTDSFLQTEIIRWVAN